MYGSLMPARRQLHRLLVLLLLLGLPAVAAWGASSPAPRGTQFVFVIDDSGSMKGHGNDPAADPDRLAVFSVNALLSMLDPQDEASVVRLNGPLEGDEPPPLEPLAENRGELERLLGLEGELASYDGGRTPCRSALEATRHLLQRAHRPNVAQVVMFLTDGRCTPQDQEPRVQPFLQGLESHEEGLFRFYLLRFEGRSFSRELAELAQATDGQVIQVNGEEPTEILEPFADALTRSQGYEAELLTPDEKELAAHRGARRVRLLAVAPGSGPPLELRIADLQGRSPDLLKQTQQDTHRFRDGRIYRYATVDYRPTTSPITVDVENAGSRWKVVAVPEYRLTVDLSVRRGTCDDPGPEVRHGIEVGTPICAVMRLVNERGQPVEREGVGQVEAYVLYGPDMDDLGRQPATPQGDTAVFTFERRRVEPGDHVFRPVVELRLPGKDVPIRLSAPPLGLEASTVRIQPRPASLDFGTLRPGESSSPRSLVFEGNFTPTAGALEVADRPDLPPCVTFTLSGEPEGAAQPIRAGTPMTVVAQVAPYCGPQNVERTFSPILRLSFPEDGGGTFLPTAEIGARLNLEYRIERPSELVFDLRAGESGSRPLDLGGNQVAAYELNVLLDSTEDRAGWAEELRLGLSTGDGEASLQETTATFRPDSSAAPLRLRLDSGECCPDGTYESAVAFVPPPDQVAPRGSLYAFDPDPLVVPVRVQVEGAGFWACRGNAVLWGLLILLLVLLLLYAWLMWQNSTFLDRDRLAEALIPLQWDGYGGTQRDSRSNGEVRAMVRRSLPFPERAKTWLRSNPFVFGLPGGSYRETAELTLEPQRSVDRSRVRLVPGRDLQRRVEAEPAPWAGRLFVQAQGRGGLEFFGVPRRGRLGRLVPQRLQSQFSWQVEESGDEATPLKVFRLRRREQLLHPLPTGDRTEGQAAGWQVG